MTETEARAVIKRLTYKPGWTFELQNRGALSGRVVTRAHLGENGAGVIDRTTAGFVHGHCPRHSWRRRG